MLEMKPSPGSQPSLEKETHQFKVTTFKSPTDCVACLKFIWGLWSQGYTCTRCKMPVHPDCRGLANQEGCKLVPLLADAWQQEVKERRTKPAASSPSSTAGVQASPSSAGPSQSSGALTLTLPSGGEGGAEEEVTVMHVEQWRVHSRWGTSTLISFAGTYLRADEGSSEVNLVQHCRGWEQWVIRESQNDGNTVALLSKHGTYLRALESGGVTQSPKKLPSPSSADRWLRIPLPDGRYAFRSTSTGKFLCAVNSESLNPSPAHVIPIPNPLFGGASLPSSSVVGAQAHLQTLKLMTMREGKFVKVWHDHGTRCQPYDSQFFRPVLPAGWVSLGDVAEVAGGHGLSQYTDQPSRATRERTIIAQDCSALARPLDYEMVWADVDTAFEAKFGPFSLWRPIPPPGFVAVGHVAHRHRSEKPSVDLMRCLHGSLVLLGSTSQDHEKGMIWANKRFGGSMGPVSVWLIQTPSGQDAKTFNPCLPVGTFYAEPSHGPPRRAPTFCLAKSRVSFVSTTQAPTASTKLAEMSSPVSSQSILELTNRTYFDTDELLLIFALFDTAARRKPFLDLDGFRGLFGKLQCDEGIISSIFQTLDLDGSGQISFPEFVVALSTICRGRFQDRVGFSFRICDLDNSGLVTYSEVLSISQSIQNMMKQVAMQPIMDQNSSVEFLRRTALNVAMAETTKKRPSLHDFSTSAASASTILAQEQYFDSLEIPEGFETPYHPSSSSPSPSSTPTGLRRIDSTGEFSKRPRSISSIGGLEEASLTECEFRERAKVDPVFAHCFGLFDFIYERLLVPIEKKRYGDHLNVKAIEGPLQKKKEGFLVSAFYDTRYFVIQNGFMTYYKTKESYRGNEPPVGVVSLHDAVASVGSNDDGEFQIDSSSFGRTMIAESKTERIRFVQCIRNNVFSTSFRFGSFAPIRHDIQAKWLINGDDYFRSLIPTLINAKRSIFIADWYFSPGLYLDRGTAAPLYRVDRLLLQKAKQGVKINVLIWNAPSVGFDLQSQFVISHLSGLHPNISALSHPSWTPVIWSHHQKFVVVDDYVAFVGGIDLCYCRYDNERYALTDPGGHWYPGRDYSNLNFKGESNGPTRDQVLDRNAFPRMPWHDIHMQVLGEAAQDISRNFIQRWNHALRTTTREMRLLLAPRPPIAPPEAELLVPDRSGFHPGLEVQALRSACTWSAGIMEPERSIYQAYLHLIANAKHYIYIENQYFISSITAPLPVNKIAEAIFQRISRAIQNQETFRVIVLLPVFPAGDLRSAATRYIIKHGYKTVNRSDDRRSSLFERLRLDHPTADISQYLAFFSLRNYSISEADGMRKPMTEQIYIHAKMLIVDDDHVIIGSANINDRSMEGLRDSEIAFVVSSTPATQIPGMMNGTPVPVSPFAQSLRIRLWANYLGIPPEEALATLVDPTHSATYTSLLRDTAASNTEIFNQVFSGLPDVATTLADLKPGIDDLYVERLASIRGYLIYFPLNFLSEEDNSPALFRGDAEWLMPKIAFL